MRPVHAAVRLVGDHSLPDAPLRGNPAGGIALFIVVSARPNQDVKCSD